MDIYIKSFNRPYYLGRCLHSIRRFAQGEYKITVLDDGTPPEYLAKIQQLFPHIAIKKSDQYNEKVAAIQDHIAGDKAFSKTNIPTTFWRDSIEDGSSIFLLLEEDTWLTDPVNLDDMQVTMLQHGLITVKIGWNGSPLLVQGKKRQVSDTTEEIVPAIPQLPEFAQRALLKNTLKTRSILQRLGILKPSFTLPYYSLYTVTSAFFDKKYWLWIWGQSGEAVNEGHQLYRAAQYAKEHETKYGKTVYEKVRTSFITSAVNRLKTVRFDMVALHHQLNEAWLRGNLDAMEQFPRDFNVDYLKTFLFDIYPECTSRKWDEWINEFKALYKSVGSIVDN